ncbi:MAG: bifunctional riboflavin kinase/FAD synthetase [Rhodothermales bacterium]
MKRQFGLEQIHHDPTSVVTVGTFDGVHVGHQAILKYLAARADARGGSSVVLSFDPHPREVVHNTPVPLLTTIDERADAVERIGIDRFVTLPFTEAFSKLDAVAFVEDVLIERIGLREIVIGYDHAFGRDRQGNAELLKELGTRYGFTVDVIPPQVVEEHVVSSTEIRALLSEKGNVTLAAEMLGRPYGLHGTVVRGDGRGRKIGFPTANIAINHPRKVVPATGVYAVRVQRMTGGKAGRQLNGMMNIGYRPTFGGGEHTVEVHLLDFDEDVYGEDLRIEFVRHLREERRFESKDELVEQLSRDRSRCIHLLGEGSPQSSEG